MRACGLTTTNNCNSGASNHSNKEAVDLVEIPATNCAPIWYPTWTFSSRKSHEGRPVIEIVARLDDKDLERPHQIKLRSPAEVALPDLPNQLKESCAGQISAA